MDTPFWQLPIDHNMDVQYQVAGNHTLFIYLPAFLDTGLPRGNVHERDSGPMQGAIPTQSHNP